MRTYNEIRENKNALYSELENVKNAIETETNEFISIMDLRERAKDINRHLEKIESLESRKNVLALALKVESSNENIALFYELAPAVITVLSKYVGKSYGPKTKEKISDEFETLTGFKLWVYASYSSLSIHCFKWNENNSRTELDIRVQDSNGHYLEILQDNKLISITMENLSIPGLNKYIENPIEHANAIISKYAELLELEKHFKSEISNFNSLLTGNMNYLHDGSTFYKRYDG